MNINEIVHTEDGIGPIGYVVLRDGKTKRVLVHKKNMVTAQGKEFLMSKLLGDVNQNFSSYKLTKAFLSPVTSETVFSTKLADIGAYVEIPLTDVNNGSYETNKVSPTFNDSSHSFIEVKYTFKDDGSNTIKQQRQRHCNYNLVNLFSWLDFGKH